MIPQRITVEGFLSYAESQTVTFEGHSLWMLAGANGSGKSSLFDAITYALFGQHRGGTHHAAELINKDCDKLLVEFEFELDGEMFVARRTLTSQDKKTCSIRQQGADDQWLEVDNTGGVAGMKDWVKQHVGLDHNTFILSVMLLQGRANELLEKNPSQRHEALGQIVGLKRYETLCQRAHDHRKRHKATADAASTRLENLKAVPVAEIQSKEKRLAKLAEQKQEHEKELAAAEELKNDAVIWYAHQQQRADHQGHVKSLANVLENSDTISRDYQEHERLRKSLPDLQHWTSHQQEGSELQTGITKLQELVEQKGKEKERLQVEVRDVEVALKELEGALQDVAKQGEQLRGQLRDWEIAAPWLKQFVAQRTKIHEAVAELASLNTEIADLKNVKEKHAAKEVAVAVIAHAKTDCETAQEQHAKALADCENLQQQWDRFRSLDDESACTYCGQPLLPEHREQETDRLKRERKAADDNAKITARELATKQKQLKTVGEEHQQWEQTHRSCKERMNTAQTKRQQLEQTMQQAETSCGEAWQALPEKLRQRISKNQPTSWVEAEFPSVQEFQTLHEEYAAVQTRCAELGEFTTTIVTQISEQTSGLANLEESQKEAERVCHETNLEVAKQVARFESLVEQKETFWKRLPSEWQVWPEPTAIKKSAELAVRLSELKAAEIVRRHEQLAQAQQQSEFHGKEIAKLEEKIAAIPEASRREPSELDADIAKLRGGIQQNSTEAEEAKTKLTLLKNQQQQRTEAESVYKQADLQRSLWKRIADRLSRQGLQRALVREAEQQITNYANATLDRLSAGQMSLELRPAEESSKETALDLIVRTETSSQPLSVTFLSGSQKFRVAVALSLAIGQYASSHHRPVQAVVIDEGFGCLDAENRQVMISEIQSLQSQLQRIILVSHQEEFTDAFPHGYQVTLEEGGSRVTEFHR